MSAVTAPAKADVDALLDLIPTAELSSLCQGSPGALDMSGLTQAQKLLLAKLLAKMCLGGPFGPMKEVVIDGSKTSIKAIFGHTVSKESLEATALLVKAHLAAKKYDAIVSDSLMYNTKGDLWPGNGYAVGETKVWIKGGMVKKPVRVGT